MDNESVGVQERNQLADALNAFRISICLSDSDSTLEVPVHQLKNILPSPSKLTGNDSWKTNYIDYLNSASLEDERDQLGTNKIYELKGKSNVYSNIGTKGKQDSTTHLPGKSLNK